MTGLSVPHSSTLSHKWQDFRKTNIIEYQMCVLLSLQILSHIFLVLVCSKIEIDGSLLEQVKQFNYLGCELSLDGEPDFDKK